MLALSCSSEAMLILKDATYLSWCNNFGIVLLCDYNREGVN